MLGARRRAVYPETMLIELVIMIICFCGCLVQLSCVFSFELRFGNTQKKLEYNFGVHPGVGSANSFQEGTATSHMSKRAVVGRVSSAACHA